MRPNASARNARRRWQQQTNAETKIAHSNLPLLSFMLLIIINIMRKNQQFGNNIEAYTLAHTNRYLLFSIPSPLNNQTHNNPPPNNQFGCVRRGMHRSIGLFEDIRDLNNTHSHTYTHIHTRIHIHNRIWINVYANSNKMSQFGAFLYPKESKDACISMLVYL